MANKKNTKKKIERKPLALKHLLGKAVLLCAIVIAVLFIMDRKQVFGKDDLNNHLDWKWDWYYKLAENNVPLDVLFIGNSHMLTGFNPYLFTQQSGLNCFILGAPGVNVADLYFTLEEALKVTKPKVVVLETYAINESEQYELEKGDLNDQIKSFKSRRNLPLKVKSTPFLFAHDNWLIAWSDVLRNHNMIFEEPDQIRRNLKNGGPRKSERRNVYLGQFSRFQKGISQNTLIRYRNEGAPVDGEDYSISSSSEKYTRKFAELCKENDVKLIFLTIPMYHEHVKNYDTWHKQLYSCIGRLSPYWLDLQEQNLTNIYTAEAFEDTYSKNQHLSSYGMNITALVFAQYLDNVMNWLPKRFNDPQWQKYVATFPLKR